VDRVDLSQRPFKVYVGEDVIETQSLILATGATAKRLGIPGEKTFWQKGISACAICDGGLPMFRGKPIVVIGGGDVAAEEALHLTHFASHVTLLVRRDVLRASKAMQEKLMNNEKVTIMRYTEAVEALGDQFLTELKVINNQTQETQVLEVAGLFYAIGHTPNTAFLENQVATDETGYILTTPGTAKTNIEGVFAAGDVQDRKYRQAITSAGSGCMAALEAEAYLSENK
jgi:thioredoxin reductase (NADPH)